MNIIKLPHTHCTNSAADTAIPDTESFRAAADVFKQLCDTTRIKIFWILCHGEECITNLSAEMAMTSPAVSHHIKQLRESGLITGSRRGKEVFYKAADTEEARLLHIMIERVIEIGCPADKHTPKDEPKRHSADFAMDEIHKLLVSDLTRRFTIDELSRYCLINTTTLKSRFKAAYGMPIAAYMKEYRVKTAAAMLRDTDESVAEIARRVGYRSQSKFTDAFKSITNLLPSDYRKSFRKRAAE